MVEVYHRMVDVYRRMVEVYRRMVEVYHRMVEVYHRMVEVYRRMVGVYHRMVLRNHRIVLMHLWTAPHPLHLVPRFLSVSEEYKTMVSQLLKAIHSSIYLAREWHKWLSSEDCLLPADRSFKLGTF
ncbi:MAG: hypothetical protein K6T99_10480 [Armatimonadetes bacterium]|nr:hypothetical protein [Armatimonadota bacterium]